MLWNGHQRLWRHALGPPRIMTPQCVGNEVCKQCGAPIRRGEIYTCPAYSSHQPAVNFPTPIEGGIVHRYVSAVERWKAAGSPQRTAKEIAAVLAICEACEHFQRGLLRNSCKVCGCSLNAFEKGLVNKIAMATESCPLNPPKWTATQVRQSE